MAPPRKRSKRRRVPNQASPVRSRPQPPNGRAPVDPGGAIPPPDVDPVAAGAPDEVPSRTLEDIDLAAGAPPEDLGVPTSHPPDGLGIVTGELPPAEDDAELAVDEPPHAPRPGRVGRATEDQLDAEDELLPAARKVKGGPPATVGANKVTSFLRASWAELQRVQWPDRRQVGQATAVVLGFVVIAGGYLGLADLISQKIVDAIL